MKTLFRLSLCAGLTGALLVGGSYACPSLTARLGLNLAEFVELQRRLEESQRQAEELEHLSRLVYQTLVQREQILEEVRGRHVGLIEAAARFRDISRALPTNNLEMLRLAYRCPTDEECYCRQVIHYLRGGAMYHPDMGAAADALEAELADRLQRGPIHLPESSTVP